MEISWFSAGVSSAVATKIALDTFPDLKIIYTHIEDQHEDTLRFINDCEKWFDRKVLVLQSDKYKTVDDACRALAYLTGNSGAACTRVLKKRVRQEWEKENLPDTPNKHIYIWGIDIEETQRVSRIVKANQDFQHIFPLIENNITKDIAHGMLKKANIKRPYMYDLGYPNNNCIGCIRGGMGYWNRIRKDFPAVFKARCDLEDTIGYTLFREFKLKDLPDDKGKMECVVPDCGLFCEIPINQKGLI